MVPAILAVPLFLGGCGLPLGVQIASLVADGISFATTDKTISDHGLSAVTSRDCAVWRGLKGEDICRPDEPEIYLAQADTDELRPPPYDEEMMLTDQQLADEKLAEMDVAAGGAREMASTEPARKISNAKPRPLPEIAPAEANGGMFYVIASFRQVRHARRMINRQPKLGARVLAGTAKGRPVYRVAIGPVAKPDRRRVRRRLARAGFADAWKLALENPKIVLEVAALR